MVDKKLLLLVILILLLFSFINIQIYLYKPRVLGISFEKKTLENERVFWEEIVTKYPTYRDGWLKLYEIDYKLGNLDWAKIWLSNAEKIDPNSEKVIGLKKELGL